MTYKTLNRLDVLNMARALITVNGMTTTLEVKNVLRKRGFFATQDMVREFMLDITSKGGEIQYKESGDGYRIYYFVDESPTVPAANNTAILYSDPTDGDDMYDPRYANHAIDSYNASGPITIQDNTFGTVHRDLVVANYRVTDEDGLSLREYFNVNRRQARKLWAKETGNHYFSARTSKFTVQKVT
jgi:hypothetical protein